MPCYHSSLGSRIRSWLRDYDRIQDLAVILIYVQIGCALVGSLGALFNGVLLINLVIALFALVAIESSSQSLGRTYAVLLFCAIILDISWLILFSGSIWNFAPAEYGTFIVFSLRLALSMQIIGFSVRFLSSFLWIQMYRLGPGSIDSTAYHEVDFDVRSSFLNPATHEIARENSNSEEFIGGSIYDPAYFSSLFEDSQDNGYLREDHFRSGYLGLRGPAHAGVVGTQGIRFGGDGRDDKRNFGFDRGSTSMIESPQLKSCVSRSFQIIDVDNVQRTPEAANLN